MRVPLKDHATDGLLTGKEGAGAWRAVSRELGGPGEGTPVEVDFRGIKAVTVPFVDEFLVPLLGGWATGYHEDLPLLLVHTGDDVRRTIDVALGARKLAVLSLSDGEPQILGGDHTLKETAGSVAALDADFTASELAGQLGLTLPAANNRLRGLLRSGAVARVRSAPVGGGREYLYRFAARR